MTLPDERYKALMYAKTFLRDLLDPKITPKTPKAVRQRAYSVLKHFPTEYEIHKLSLKNPDVLRSTNNE